MRPLALFTYLLAALSVLAAFATPACAAESKLLPAEAARHDAHAIHALLASAIAAPDPARPSLGSTLANYAKSTGNAPDRHEGLEAASRRILAGGTTTLVAPDATSQRLLALANSLTTNLDRIDATRLDLRPPDYTAQAPALRATALLARFHARRLLAAIHYNLFLRGQRLAELYAATLDTQAAIETWRALVALAGDRKELTFGSPPVTLAGDWRAELTRLEFDYKDLEAMCCPPDESWLREKVWAPAAPPGR